MTTEIDTDETDTDETDTERIDADGIDTDGIESVFEETDRLDWATAEFRGTSTCGESRVVYEYVLGCGNEYLEEVVRYYLDDDLVRERVDWWLVDSRSETIVGSGEPIAEFCRDRCESDPRVEFEYLSQRDR